MVSSASHDSSDRYTTRDLVMRSLYDVGRRIWQKSQHDPSWSSALHIWTHNWMWCLSFTISWVASELFRHCKYPSLVIDWARGVHSQHRREERQSSSWWRQGRVGGAPGDVSGVIHVSPGGGEVCLTSITARLRVSMGENYFWQKSILTITSQ